MLGYEGAIVNRTIDVKTLPAGIRGVLARVGHHRPVVVVEARTRTSIASCAGQGSRGFAIKLDDVNSTHEAFRGQGSWGGANPWVKNNPIDGGTDSERDVPEGGAWIRGTESDRHTSCYVAVTPLTMARIVAADHPALVVAGDALAEGRDPAVVAALVVEALSTGGPDPLSHDDRRVMYAYGAIKAGDYRKRLLAEIADGGPSWSASPRAGLGAARVTEIVESLIARGYLKRASNGATAMTTAGKVLRGPAGGRDVW